MNTQIAMILKSIFLDTASGTASTADAANTQGSMWTMILIYAVIIGGLYFIMIRPQSKKKKEEDQMRNNIEINDEITTIGGIVGRVVAFKGGDNDDSIIIETSSDRTKMRIKRWAIASIDTEKAAPAPEKKEKKGFFSKFSKDKSEEEKK